MNHVNVETGKVALEEDVFVGDKNRKNNVHQNKRRSLGRNNDESWDLFTEENMRYSKVYNGI